MVRGWRRRGAGSHVDGRRRLELADSISRQTRSLESVGVLEAHDQQHRLTESGTALGRAIAEDDTPAAVEQLRSLLAEWALSETLRAALAGRSLSEAAVVAELADAAGEEPEGRVRTGLTTLLDCYVWTGLIERGGYRYRLPDDSTAGGTDGDRSTLNVGLELSVDLDPEDVEGLVTALRKGLAADLDDPKSSALAADLRVDDDGAVHLDAEPEERTT